MKSIFSRLLVTYFVIILFIIFILTAGISIIYKEIVMDEKKASFESIAKRTGILTQAYQEGKINYDELNASINGMSYSADAMIYVIKIKKEDFAHEKVLSTQGFTDDFIYEDLKYILEGKQVFRKNEYSQKLETYVAYMGYPLKLDSKIEGVILLFCPINNINQNIMQMNQILWLCAGAIFMMSIPVILVSSRKISRPIEHIERAARSIAKGQNTDTITVHSKDEIGMLAHSFNNMKEQLEINEKVQRDFIASVSHELRTPLTSIGGFVEGLLDGVIPMEESSEYLQIIQGETKRLVNLTTELLDKAKIQSGFVKLNNETLPLKQISTEAIWIIKEKADQKSIKINNLIKDGFLVFMDRERLMQIFINILSNAIKYTGENGLVSINATEENHWIRISIRDTGIGIAKEELPFIFDRFYRSNTHVTSHESSGLGLSIVKDLVVVSGGNIEAQSQLGIGTCISFTINKEEG